MQNQFSESMVPRLNRQWGCGCRSLATLTACFLGFIAFFVFHRVFSNPGGPARFFPALGFCSKVKQNIINPSISGYPHKPISASQVESLQSSETAPCGDSLIGLDRVPARSSPMCPMLKFGALGALGLPILKPWNATWVLGQTRCFGETKLGLFAVLHEIDGHQAIFS